MELTDDQKQEVTGWINEGLGLSEVQSKILEDFSLSMTYMEVRFLVDDLNLALQDDETAVGDNIVDGSGAQSGPVQGDGAGTGGINISINKINRPGSVVSGSVSFADGNSVEWQIDSQGRLGIIPGSDGYKPSEEDIMEFQTALQAELQKSGL